MKARKSLAAVTTRLQRVRNKRGDLEQQIYQHEISMRPLLYEKKAGAGFRSIENRANTAGLFDGYYAFDELLTGGFIERLQADRPVLKLMYGDASLDLSMENITEDVLGERSYSGGSTRIVYPNAWNNTDLHYVLGGHLVNKQIHLRSGHPREFKFRLKGKFRPRLVGDHVELGKEFAIVQPYLTYTPSKFGESSPIGNNRFTLQLKWSMRKVKDGLSLIVRLPEGDWSGWVLDPTITLQPGATGIDANAVEEVAGTNYGDSTRIEMHHVGPWRIRGYIKFDLASIPRKSTLVSGTFSTWLSNDLGSPNIRHEKVSASWGEKTLTWNNMPAAADLVMPDDVRTGAPTITSITAQIAVWQDWFDSPATNYGFRMTTLANTFTFVKSSDHATAAQRPKLTIYYTVPAGRLAAYTLNVWDPERRILDRQGRVVPPNEVRPDNWLDLEGLEPPGSRTYPSYVEDPSKLLIVEASYREGEKVPGIKSDRSQFGDVIVERVAGGHAG